MFGRRPYCLGLCTLIIKMKKENLPVKVVWKKKPFLAPVSFLAFSASILEAFSLLEGTQMSKLE